MLYDVTIDGKNYRLDLNRAEGRWSAVSTDRSWKLMPFWLVRMCFRFASETWRMK
jgi:hypothetical protein